MIPAHFVLLCQSANALSSYRQSKPHICLYVSSLFFCQITGTRTQLEVSHYRYWYGYHTYLYRTHSYWYVVWNGTYVAVKSTVGTCAALSYDTQAFRGCQLRSTVLARTRRSRVRVNTPLKNILSHFIPSKPCWLYHGCEHLKFEGKRYVEAISHDKKLNLS